MQNNAYEKKVRFTFSDSPQTILYIFIRKTAPQRSAINTGLVSVAPITLPRQGATRPIRPIQPIQPCNNIGVLYIPVESLKVREKYE